MHPGDPANPHASAWFPHPDNWGERAESQLIKSLREAAPAAAEHGLAIHLEGHQVVTLRDAETMAAVIDAVGSPMVKCDLDPANWITLETVFDTTPAIEHMFEVLGDRVGSGHAKDVEIENRLAIHIDNVPAGDGRLDFQAFIKGLEALGPETYLIIEGCPVEDTERVRGFLVEQATEAGVTIRE
jgi:sugar phosphate isomerase/epimerase